MKNEFSHSPVMLQEVLAYLDIKPGAKVVDATAGGGGHLRALANAVGSSGKVFAFDRDIRAHQTDAAGGVVADFPKQVSLFHAPFSQIEPVLKSIGVLPVDGLLCDLGVSSAQLDLSERGFSFLREGPIDMRMDQSQGETAYDLIHRASEKELADIIYQYGEERQSRRIAKAIVEKRPLPDSTLTLASIVASACGGQRGRIHPATRTFQALRIAVNQEFEELDQLLASIKNIIAIGGRATFITFHSLEDRRVKVAFKELVTNDRSWHLLFKKVQIPSDEEMKLNPRARSAKVRTIVHSPLEKGGKGDLKW